MLCGRGEHGGLRGTRGDPPSHPPPAAGTPAGGWEPPSSHPFPTRLGTISRPWNPLPPTPVPTPLGTLSRPWDPLLSSTPVPTTLGTLSRPREPLFLPPQPLLSHIISEMEEVWCWPHSTLRVVGFCGIVPGMSSPPPLQPTTFGQAELRKFLMTHSASKIPWGCPESSQI